MNNRTRFGVLTAALALLVCAGALAAQQQAQREAQRPGQAQQQSRPEWSMNATAIEACSCPMFCPCYFNTEPAGHAGHGGEGAMHFCLFNMAYKVNHGHIGDTKLDGAKFWISGDLGDSWSDGEMEWALLRFDPSVTPEQRKGILAAVPALFPAKWKSFKVGEDAPIEWTANKNRAVAKLDGGKAAEITLNRVDQSNAPEPVVIQNLRYWGAPRNDGFVLMKTEHHATRQTPEGIKPYEFKDCNGFMITVDINAADAAKAAAAAKTPGNAEKAAGHEGGGH